MSLRKQLLTTALFFSATAATAAITPDQLITAYRNQGYTSVEVKLGPTQIKVEAVSGRQKIEVIYDRLQQPHAIRDPADESQRIR